MAGVCFPLLRLSHSVISVHWTHPHLEPGARAVHRPGSARVCVRVSPLCGPFPLCSSSRAPLLRLPTVRRASAPSWKGSDTAPLRRASDPQLPSGRRCPGASLGGSRYYLTGGLTEFSRAPREKPEQRESSQVVPQSIPKRGDPVARVPGPPTGSEPIPGSSAFLFGM